MRVGGLDYGQAGVKFWVQCVQYMEEGLHINCQATVRSQTDSTGSCSCRTDSRPSCSTSECTTSPAGQGHSWLSLYPDKHPQLGKNRKQTILKYIKDVKLDSFLHHSFVLNKYINYIIIITF